MRRKVGPLTLVGVSEGWLELSPLWAVCHLTLTYVRTAQHKSDQPRSSRLWNSRMRVFTGMNRDSGRK